MVKSASIKSRQKETVLTKWYYCILFSKSYFKRRERNKVKRWRERREKGRKEGREVERGRRGRWRKRERKDENENEREEEGEIKNRESKQLQENIKGSGEGMLESQRPSRLRFLHGCANCWWRCGLMKPGNEVQVIKASFIWILQKNLLPIQTFLALVLGASTLQLMFSSYIWVSSNLPSKLFSSCGTRTSSAWQWRAVAPTPPYWNLSFGTWPTQGGGTDGAFSGKLPSILKKLDK